MLEKPLDKDQAVSYAGFIGAAYAMFWRDESVLTPDPSAYMPDGWNLLAWITMKDFLLGNIERFYGFLAEDSSGSTVLAIRGTGSNVLAEWLEDADCIAVPFAPVPAVGHVAQGFARVYGSMSVYPHSRLAAHAAFAASGSETPAPLSGTFGEQIAHVLQLRATQRQAQIQGLELTTPPPQVVTGHSLGAALCTLYVMENLYKAKIVSPTLCTFASPRVGNAQFVTTFNSLPGLTSWRVVNKPDLVPNLPPDIWQWVHVNDEYLLDSSNSARRTLGCAHDLQTYISLLDPAQQSSPSCRL